MTFVAVVQVQCVCVRARVTTAVWLLYDCSTSHEGPCGSFSSAFAQVCVGSPTPIRRILGDNSVEVDEIFFGWYYRCRSSL